MDATELRRRLAGIEGPDLELKAAAGGVPDDAYKTISSFANTAGGWLVLGVSERQGAFVITGVNDPERMQNDLVTACRSTEKFSRPVDVTPRVLTLDGATLLAFQVPAATRYDKPVRVRSRKTWESYVRIGAADHLCTIEEEGRFLRDASLTGFDDQPGRDATLDDLSPRAIRWLRAMLAERHPERADVELDDAGWMLETGLLCGPNQPTNAALLLFGRDRALARLKPAGMLDLRFIDEDWAEGGPEHRWDDRELYEDNLVGTLRGALDRLARRLPQPFALDGETGRSVARPPDFRVIREALVNLLVHQDYADRNRTARVLWYRDRVIFENPGDSYVSLGAMLDGGVSQLRNPLLARMLRRAGFAEQAGTGMMAIVRDWRARGRRPPRVENDTARKQFRLTLSFAPLLSPEISGWLRRLSLTDEDAGRVLATARGGPTLTWAEARLATGLPGHRLARLIARLISDGLLLPCEHDPEGSWTLASGRYDEQEGSARPPAALVREPSGYTYDPPRALERHARTLLDVIRRRPGLRVPDLTQETGFSAATVKRALILLRQQGEITFEGSPREGGYQALTAEPQRPSS